MPWGIALLLAYALLILAGVGLSLPAVIDLAIDAPVSLVGLVVMALLAYTIFTITLVLQRKQAAYLLSLGLASLTLPLIFLLGNFAGAPGALFALALAAILFLSLRRPRSRAWFNEL
jgi:hypothetical protein